MKNKENKTVDLLLEKELVLWSGAPKSDLATFGFRDIKFIAAGLFGFAIASIVILQIYRARGYTEFRVDGVILFCLMFFVYSLYQIFFMFWVNLIVKKNTLYFLSNQRVVIINNITHKCKYEYLKKIESVDIVKSAKKTFSCHFGQLNYWDKKFRNSGLGFLSGFYGEKTLSFFDVNDGATLMKLLKKLTIKQFTYDDSNYY
jgi:hypothetical protein